MLRKTKIVCTIGPASEREEILRELIKAGMNVARLNFSHGDYNVHGERIRLIRKLSEELETPIPILQDLQGPKIRVGEIENDKVFLKDNEEIALTPKELVGNEKLVSVSYPHLLEDINIGDRILIDDGLIELKVIDKKEDKLICHIIHGGYISSRKGVNFPDSTLRVSPLTEKDKKDVLFGIEKKVDFIALSFVQRASDILELKEFLELHDARIPVIAKIEKREAVNNFREILEVADGIMVARGDLAIEMSNEEVPLIQKKIIRETRLAGKPVITATQMLISMVNNPTPTRAEVSDVANAILDGTDAVMLSNETATGKYPVESVQIMDKIARRVEKEFPYDTFLQESNCHKNITEAITFSTCQIAKEIEASAIVTATHSGFTARHISKYRPKAPIFAITHFPEVQRRLNLSWGVTPLLTEVFYNTDEMFEKSTKILLQKNYVKRGDTIVITAGIPMGISGMTNLIKVHVISDVIGQGHGLGGEAKTAKVIIAKNAKEAISKVTEDVILLIPTFEKELEIILDKLQGIIIEDEKIPPFLIPWRSKGISIIVGAKNLSEKLKDNEIITIDPERGVIYRGVARIY
ncbi:MULTISPECIES: pyruvate kinase [Dictyoglomus]|uniref:Pyruvate kinase n=3 Tax=Dictyoglomus TaxID=13 RepID=B8E0P8_DICTD|nr:pyruvate kinase [Dictyoglomus turgidum]ACK43068.1 pyruvate kinase [Dictyoglomus turgidum DSM 6724]PNV78664.1 MAG: pyruvate kinase [Dictyoglomus turgidum]